MKSGVSVWGTSWFCQVLGIYWRYVKTGGEYVSPVSYRNYIWTKCFKNCKKNINRRRSCQI